MERGGYLAPLDLHSLQTGPRVPVEAIRSVLAASSDGGKAVVQVQGSDGVRLVDLQTGAVVRIDIDASDTVDSAILSAEGDHLLLALGSGVVERRNAETGSVEGSPTKLPGFQPAQSVVSFAENGRALAVRSGEDDHVDYYGISPSGVLGRPIKVGASAGSTGVYQIGISPGGQYVAAAASQGDGAVVSVVDVTKQQVVASKQFPRSVHSLDLAVSAGQPIIATSVEDQGADVWTGFSTVLRSVLTDANVDSVALSPDGSTLLTSGDDRVAVADLHRAPLARTLPEEPVIGPPFDILDDGLTTYVLRRESLTAYEEGKDPVAVLTGQTGTPRVLVRGSTGVELMTAADGGLRAYSVTDRAWRDVPTDQQGDGPWQGLRTTSDRRYLVAKSSNRLALLDPATGKERFSVGPGDAKDGVPLFGDLDASGDRFAWWSTQGGGVSIVEVDTRRSSRMEVPDTSVQDAAFLTDGRLVVASSSGLSVFDGDAPAKPPVRWELPQGRSPVFLTPDGDYLAVLASWGDQQSQLLIYDATTARPALQLGPSSGTPGGLVTGRRLSAISTETIEVEPVWRDSQQLFRMLCASVARTLTMDERERFLSGRRVQGCRS